MSSGGVAVHQRNGDGGISERLKLIAKKERPELGTGGAAVEVAGESSGGWVSRATAEKLLVERDMMWRQHERAQIQFLQKEHASMLKDLHKEIERLQNMCRHLASKLASKKVAGEGWDAEAEENQMFTMEADLQIIQEQLDELRLQNLMKEERIEQLKNEKEEIESRSRLDIHQKAQKIKELGQDVSNKASLIAQLSAELHQLRLKAAVERQKVERGESRQEPSGWDVRRSRVADSEFPATPPRPFGVSVHVVPPPLRRFSSPASTRGRGRLSSSGFCLDRPSSAGVALPPIHSAQQASYLGRSIEKPSSSGSARSSFRSTKDTRSKSQTEQE